MRGLANKVKRKAIFKYFKDTSLDVIFVQESYCTDKNIKLWEAEWGNKWLYSPWTNQSRGTAIIVRPNLNCDIEEVLNDKNGRYVIANIKIDDSRYTLCNIYAPNEDDPNFFRDTFKTMGKYATENIIIGGDFNLTFNVSKDRKNTTKNNNNAAKYVKEFMSENDLCDIWRNLNMDDERYTWFKRMNNVMLASGLDMFIVSQGVANKTKNTSIAGATRTDHSLIKLEIVDEKFKRGPGNWKLNVRLLEDEKFYESMSQNIIECKATLKKTDKSRTKCWEILKTSCKKCAMEYSKNSTRMKKDLLKNLYQLRYEWKMDQCQTFIQNDEMVDLVNNKIELLEKEQVEGAIFRSRCKWSDEAEKMTKYFFALERRNYNNKTMFAVIPENGQLSRCQKTILKEQEKFYRELYAKDTNVRFTITNTTGIMISNEQKRELDTDLTWLEIVKSIKELPEGKVCGSDGLPIEFYTKFLELFKEELWAMYQEVVTNGILGHSARKGLMALLPKGNCDPNYIKNYRPLTILNTDYKVLAKTVATRLKRVLPDIIGDQQNGFMEGRNIQSSIRETIDIVSHINNTKQKAVIVSIDFLKCFDRIEHDSIYNALRYFNFGEKFISLIRLFYTEFRVCTQNAGHASELFAKTRGINQGCNVSPFCFNVCSEIMAHLIKNNPLIHGIKIGQRKEVEKVISQFADDTCLFLLYTENCLNATIDTLMHIEKNTGLKVSYEKSCIYRIGSLQHSKAQCYTKKSFSWSDGDLELLGVTIVNGKCQNNSGFNEIVNKMERVANNWYNRNLTIMGKTLIINTLFSSLFTYRMSILPRISENQIKKAEEIINDFLWKGKRSKIPLKVLQNPKEKGGLALTNLTFKHEALLINWVKIAYMQDKYTYANEMLCEKITHHIWECNLKQTDVKASIANKNSFWYNVLDVWSRYHYHEPLNLDEIDSQIIWYNTHIKPNGKIIRPMNNDKGEYRIIKIEQIWKDTDFLELQEFNDKFKMNVNWLWYQSLLTSIPKTWKMLLKGKRENQTKLERLNVKTLCQSKKTSSYVYQFIAKSNATTVMKYKCTWENKLSIDITQDEYLRLFMTNYKTTRVTKLRNFQYRLLLLKVFTNDILYKWKIKNSNECDFCDKKQTIIHLLIQCTVSVEVWKYLRDIFFGPEYKWEPKNIIFNQVHCKPKHLCNTIVMYIKYYIFQQKCLQNRPCIAGIQKEIKFLYEFERSKAIKFNKVEALEQRWGPVKQKISIEY